MPPAFHKPTFRQKLISDANSSYRLNKSESVPVLPRMSCFTSVGRSHFPATRLHQSSFTQLLVPERPPERPKDPEPVAAKMPRESKSFDVLAGF